MSQEQSTASARRAAGPGSLADQLLNPKSVSYLAGLLTSAIPEFDQQSFIQAATADLASLKLKERISHIASAVAAQLNPDFEVAAAQIHAALPPPLDPTKIDNDFGDFIFASFGEFVARHGRDHYDTSMGLLKEVTMRFSMEGAVRPFLRLSPAKTLQLFKDWARDENYHVRRLVSESTRPLLPWAPRLNLDITEPIPLLDILHADPTRYVTRSIANHLNDISKIDPSATMEALTRWRKAGRQDPDELEWMTRHALRTLIKQGDPDAMKLLGYRPDTEIEASPINVATPRVEAGDTLEFEVTLTARRTESLIVDYTIDFVKHNGQTKPKVFKLTRISLEAGQQQTIRKKHLLRADASTYRLYPGNHRLTVTANGKSLGEAAFNVATAD